MYGEYIQEDIQEVVEINRELSQENQALRDRKMVLSGNHDKIYDKIVELRNRIKLLEGELAIVKTSRGELQNKNADLMRQVNYYCKKK